MFETGDFTYWDPEHENYHYAKLVKRRGNHWRGRPAFNEYGKIMCSDFPFPLELWDKIPNDNKWHKLEYILTNMRVIYKLEGKIIFQKYF